MNYKIVSKNTGATHFLNEKEYETFLLVNEIYKDGVCQYDEYNLTKAKARRRNKMLDLVAHLCINRSFNLSYINLHSKLLLR